MAKFLPIIGEVYTAVESVACLTVSGAMVLAGEEKKAQQWFDSAGNAWKEYSETNALFTPSYGIYLDSQGRHKESEEMFTKYINAAESCVNGLPVVGHVKGIVHYAQGNKEEGNKCMEAATRTTAVFGAGILTGGLGGAVVEGAIIGVTTGVLYDETATIIDSAASGERKLHGSMALIDAEKMTPNELTQTLMGIGGDALQGAAGAKLGQNIRAHLSESAKQTYLQDRLAKDYKKAGVNNPDQAARMTMDAAKAGNEVQSGFKKNVNGCTTVVEDTANGKTGVGHSGKIRSEIRATNHAENGFSSRRAALRANDYGTPSHLQQAHPEVQPTFSQPQNACAEHSAFNNYNQANPGYTVENTRTATVSNKNGTFTTKPRCGNCRAYGPVMGDVVTDAVPANTPVHLEIPVSDTVRASATGCGGVLIRNRPAGVQNA